MARPACNIAALARFTKLQLIYNISYIAILTACTTSTETFLNHVQLLTVRESTDHTFTRHGRLLANLQ